MFRRCRLQTAKRFCRFAGFCGTVCKTMSFSLTASEFVCSTLPLLFEFCIAQFFCTVCVIFVPWRQFCHAIFALVNTVAVFCRWFSQPLNFCLCRHGVAYIKFVWKNIRIFVLYFLYIGLSLCTFFLYRMRYFCALTAILFCIFTLLNTVAVVLPLIFTTVKYLFWQTRFGVHWFVLKGEQSYCFLWSLRFCFVHFLLLLFTASAFWRKAFLKKQVLENSARWFLIPAVLCLLY